MLAQCAAFAAQIEMGVPFSDGAVLSTLFGYSFRLSMCFMVLCGLCTSVMWGGIFNMAAEGLGFYAAIGSRRGK